MICILQERIKKMSRKELETLYMLSLLRIASAREKLEEHKRDLDYEPWSIYRIKGSILFDLVNILTGSDK